MLRKRLNVGRSVEGFTTVASMASCASGLGKGTDTLSFCGEHRCRLASISHQLCCDVFFEPIILKLLKINEAN